MSIENESLVTKGLFPGRVPKDVGSYDLEYFLGKRADEGVPYPTDGSYLDPESEYRYKFQGIISWIERFLGKGSILDVGSGPGHLAYWVNRLSKPYTVVSCDVSEPLLKSEYNQNRSQSVAATATNLPFADSQFQGVLFSDILEHMWPEDALKAVKEANRVLENGGYIFINIPNRNTLSKVAKNDLHHVWLPSIREVKQLLKLGGFRAESAKIFTRGFPFSQTYQKFSSLDLELPSFGRTIRAAAQR